MIGPMTRKTFEASIIAQDDDNDYQESGWCAGIIDGMAFLTSYSHCSCYGTWQAVTDGDSDYDFDGETPQPLRQVNFDWTGTPGELKEMARKKVDPSMPGRTITVDDSDGDHLLEVYSQVLDYFKTSAPPEMDVELL